MVYLKIWRIKMTKKKDNKNINDKLYKDYRIKQFFLWTQLILVLLIIFTGISSLFNKKLLPVCTIFTALTLLVMGYNNYKVYKRKSFTIIYTLVGLITLVVGIINLIK